MTDTKITNVADAAALRQAFRSAAVTAGNDPLINPVRMIASEIFLALENGEQRVETLRKVVAQLEQDGFIGRAEAFHQSRGHQPKPADAIVKMTGGDFESFRSKVEETPIGVVFTAHPTFAINSVRRSLVADYQKSDRSTWLKRLADTPPGPPDNISLHYEHDEVINAIRYAQDAVSALTREILEVAKEQYPDQWRQLCPAPVSIASWVGYDLDGRTDIHWGQSVTIRLAEKARQLDRYVSALNSIIAETENPVLSALSDRLARAAAAAHRHAANFSGDLSNPDVVVAAANALTEDHDANLVSLKNVLATLSDEIEQQTNDNLAMRLMLLRAEMMACGLGVSKIHLRVNAAQVRTSLRSDLGLDPDQEFKDRSALDIASSKAKLTQSLAVNFGSVFLEQMTARRQFMLCSQILKHIDADTPIRFLIAECEAPATVMGAVYLARLYGIDDKLDISPLFETPTALEGGGRFIERLLENAEYRAYIQKRRRMAIQIGYSDSGRFMGQATASLGAERLQVLFSRALKRAALPDVEALIFNTHGESMGRGAFPGGYRERLDHLSTPWVRNQFKLAGLKLAIEVSFQGGEGYLHFQTADLAKGAVGALWALSAEPVPDLSDDRYYSDINYSWDIYRSLKGWQETLYSRSDYRDVIFSFPPNLLYKTGSREVKRPRSAGGQPEIRSIRAIPHNAVLQQLAVPVNVSGGLGIASGRESDRFVEHVLNSPRMTNLLKMTGRARDITSVTVLRSYAGTFAPSYWSALAGMAKKPSQADAYERVLQSLQRENIAPAISGLADFLARDLRAYDAVRAQLKESERAVNGAGVDPDIGVLHALRQALIGHAASLVAHAPEFSSRHDVDLSDIVEMALNMRLKDAADLLRRIFPKESPAGDFLNGLVEPIDVDQHHYGGAYPEIHKEIIDPIIEIDSVLCEITAAIANHYRAYG